MRSIRSVARAMLMIMIVGVASSCGGDSSTEAPTMTGLTTNFDVMAQEDVAVLDEGMVERRLVSANPAAGEYRFDGSADEVQELQVGDPVVIPGTGFGIVREVVEDGDELVLRVDEATLGDVIQDGTVEWDYDVSWSDFDVTYEELAAALPNAKLVSVDYGTGGALEGVDYQTPTPRKITIEFKQSGWGFKLELEPKEAKLEFKIVGSYSVSGVNLASVSGEGWISGFAYSTAMGFADGQPSDLSTEINSLQGEMELKWAAFRTPGTPLVSIVKVNVPLAMPIPIPGPFGIPFVLQIKMAGRIVPELSVDEASSGGSWKVSYSSDQGFNVEDSDGKATGSLKSQQVGTSGDTVTAGYGPAGFGLGLEFPRFELGVAGLGPFAFITVDMYSTSLWTPGTTLTGDIPPCQYGYTKLSAVAGYQLSIMGWGGLSDQYTLWEHQENKYLDDKECTLTGD